MLHIFLLETASAASLSNRKLRIENGLSLSNHNGTFHNQSLYVECRMLLFYFFARNLPLCITLWPENNEICFRLTHLNTLFEEKAHQCSLNTFSDKI
jgi:hypothetical protein